MNGSKTHSTDQLMVLNDSICGEKIAEARTAVEFCKSCIAVNLRRLFATQKPSIGRLFGPKEKKLWEI